MTTYQLVAIGLLVAVAAWTYLPRLSFAIPSLAKKPDPLKQIAQVMAIKDSASNPKVQDACQQLLQALIS